MIKINKMLWVVVSLIVVTGTALALDLGVGVFYAPGMAVGPAAEVNELKPLGFAGAVRFNLNKNLALSLGGGYNVFKYRDAPHLIPAIAGYAFFDEIPVAAFNVGVDYGWPVSALTPYVSGGAALAFELARYGYKTEVDVAPGVYAGAGVCYFIRENVALEIGPRYTFLFDDPVLENYSSNSEPERAGERSQWLNLRLGINYSL